MTTTTTTKTPPKPKAPNVAKIRRALDTLAPLLPDGDLREVIGHLRDAERLRLTERPKGSGTVVATLGNVQAHGPGERQALINWCNKARRTLARMEG